MSGLIDTADADRSLKAKHRAMWALGDYPSVAAEIIPDLDARLIAACGVGPRDRALDVASGSGNAAIPAAMAGATVVASDLTPAMFEAGRRQPASTSIGEKQMPVEGVVTASVRDITQGMERTMKAWWRRKRWRR